MKTRFVLLSVSGLALLSNCMGSTEGAEPIAVEKTPANVRQAAVQAVLAVKLTKAQFKTEDGRTVYEFQGKNDQGKQIEVDVTLDGTILEVETEITLREVPKVVTDELARRMKGFQPTFVDRSDVPGKDDKGRPIKIVWYEFEGRDDAGKAIEVHIDAEGKRLLIEE